MLRRFLGCLICMVIASPASAVAASSSAPATPLLTVQELSRPGGSVPLGAQRVPMLTLRMTASCAKDVHVLSLSLEHRGLGNPQDIEAVYAMSNGVRRSRSAVPSGQKGVATVHLRSFTVAACSTVSLDILGDIRSTATAAGEHAFSLVWSGNIETDPVVPVILNLAGDAAARTIPIGNATGTVAAELLPLPSTLNYGSARTVARLRLTAKGKDQEIGAITFVNDGSARNADLQNLFLETSGHTRLSQTFPQLTGDRIRIEMQPPLRLARNETRIILLLADVRASRRKTVNLLIQQPSDIETQDAK